MSQNNIPTISAGLDVARDSLALDFQGRSLELANDAKGHARLLRLLGAAPKSHVLLEAAGGCEQPAVRALHAAGLALRVLEPSRVRALARAKGLRAKTDPIDAAVRRAFGEALHPKPAAAPSAGQERLGALVLRRRQLLAFVVAESNPSAHCRDPPARRPPAALLRSLRRQIVQCAQAGAARLAAEAEMAARAARLQEVPGVGAITAATLPAERPGLGRLSDEGAAALAGVAPFNRDRGPWAGTRRIGGGRAPVRCALSMASLSAARSDPVPKSFHQRLIAAGKKPLVALTAVLRKLIVLLNRLLKNPDFKLQTAQ